MEIRRKIASKYLKNQYEKAKKYLEKEVSSSAENIDTICDRVRRVGIAYAQTEYCIFMENDSWGESVRSVLNSDNSRSSFSLYNEFVNEMETNIQRVTNDKSINPNLTEVKFMNIVTVAPLFKTDLFLNYEEDDFLLGKWYFRNKEESGRKFNVIIVEDGILTTRAMNRINSYNVNCDKQGYDDLDIVNSAWEQCVINRKFNGNDSVEITAKMNDGIIYSLKLHVYSINKHHFHFVVDLL